MKEKTGRPKSPDILQENYHDLEKLAPVVSPGTISYIYSGQWRLTSKTASFTLNGEMVVMVDASAVSITLTLPAASSNIHKVYVIKKVDSSENSVTIQGDSADETIDGEDSVILTLQYQYVTIICDGSDWYIVGGEYVKMEDLLSKLLNELIDLSKKTHDKTAQNTLHLAKMSGENITDKDVN